MQRMRKLYVEETKFTLTRREKQHEKDVQYRSLNNTIAKHVKETGHEICWKSAKILEVGKKDATKKNIGELLYKKSKGKMHICKQLLKKKEIHHGLKRGGKPKRTGKK